MSRRQRLDRHDLTVIAATGAIALAATAATLALIVAGFLAALKAENTWRTRNQAIVKGMKP